MLAGSLRAKLKTLAETKLQSHGPPDVSTQFINLPAPALGSFPTFEISRESVRRLGPNDSSINRGDRDDTGDNAARPDEMGSGPAHPTVDPTSFGGITSIRHPSSDSSAIEQEIREDDGFEIEEATDGRLGLTNTGSQPADDWAADTGPAVAPESEG